MVNGGYQFVELKDGKIGYVNKSNLKYEKELYDLSPGKLYLIKCVSGFLILEATIPGSIMSTGEVRRIIKQSALWNYHVGDIVTFYNHKWKIELKSLNDSNIVFELI